MEEVKMLEIKKKRKQVF